MSPAMIYNWGFGQNNFPRLLHHRKDKIIKGSYLKNLSQFSQVPKNCHWGKNRGAIVWVEFNDLQDVSPTDFHYKFANDWLDC